MTAVISGLWVIFMLTYKDSELTKYPLFAGVLVTMTTISAGVLILVVTAPIVKGSFDRWNKLRVAKKDSKFAREMTKVSSVANNVKNRAQSIVNNNIPTMDMPMSTTSSQETKAVPEEQPENDGWNNI